MTRFHITLITASFVALLIAAAEAEQKAPNFLFIAIDDLNDYCGYASEEPGNYIQTIYPDSKVRAEIAKRLTPNLDKLASNSASFLRSYCTSALCGPSRTSLMTGIPPYQSGYYMHDRHFRLYDSLKDTVTLPQHLKANGYYTTGLGKIFHKGQGAANGPIKNDWADAAHSWELWTNSPSGCNGGKPSKYSPPDGGLMQFGPSRLKLEESGDYLTADFAAKLLENGHAKLAPNRSGNAAPAVTLPQEKPFFLACGLFRPHLPFYAPKSYFDKFPTSEMTGLNRDELNAILEDIKDLPPGAERFSDYKNGKMKTVMEHARKVGGEEGEIEAWRDMVQSYLACVSFAHACLGRLMEGLEKSPRRDNTIVILWSDHGYHLGSKYHVAKQALWEEANRVTLLIKDPRARTKQLSGPRRQLVSLQDLYPTVCSLAGVSTPAHVHGKSLTPILSDASASEIHDEILMTYMEGNHALRTPKYRFCRYKDGSTELYEIQSDPGQIKNLAKSPEYAELTAKLSARIEKLTATE